MKESRLIRKYGRKNLFLLPPEWFRDPMQDWAKIWEEIKESVMKGERDDAHREGKSQENRS